MVSFTMSTSVGDEKLPLSISRTLTDFKRVELANALYEMVNSIEKIRVAEAFRRMSILGVQERLPNLPPIMLGV